MNEIFHTRVIALGDLWLVFRQRILWILLAALITGGTVAAVDCLWIEPEYESTAALYILRDNGQTVSSDDAVSEFSLALKMIYDCDYLLKSRSVLEAVIEELELDCTYSELRGKISTHNPTNTRILEVTVRAVTPEQAKRIVDCLCQIGDEKISRAMGVDQINLYEYGTLPTQPANRIGIATYGVLLAAAAVTAYGVFLLAFLLDDRIRTEEDIARFLGVSILARIPNYNSGRHSRYGDRRDG